MSYHKMASMARENYAVHERGSVNAWNHEIHLNIMPHKSSVPLSVHCVGKM